MHIYMFIIHIPCLCACVCMYVCVCVCLCMYTYIHTCIYVFMHIYIYIYMYIITHTSIGPPKGTDFAFRWRDGRLVEGGELVWVLRTPAPYPLRTEGKFDHFLVGRVAFFFYISVFVSCSSFSFCLSCFGCSSVVCHASVVALGAPLFRLLQHLPLFV